MRKEIKRYKGRHSLLCQVIKKGIACGMAMVLLCCMPADAVYAQKKSSKKAQANPSTPASQQAPSAPSAADLKRRQQSAQAEVKKTQTELKKNEEEVKRNLSELSRLEGDIATSQHESQVLSQEVGKLNGKISDLEGKIDTKTKELEHLRAEYLKAVKKMRVSRKRNSGMSYIFAAKDLAQAERRMRYMKEFSAWKDRQIRDIETKKAELVKANEDLKRAKSDKDVMLNRELQVQAKLSDQKKRQDVVIAELKANGAALKEHLAKKQAEVNALKNQVAALIAEEQRKAEVERRKREEAARIERERIAKQKAEEAAREKAAKEAAEKAAREKEAKEKAAQEKAAKEKAAKEKAAKEKAAKEKAQKKEVPKKDNSGKDTGDATEPKTGDYAKARKRKSRSDQSKQEPPKQEIPKQETPKQEPVKKDTPKPPSGDSGFAAAKGSLPRPVGGAWRVTGKFGRHALADLPDVIFDNPGIDVEVSKGASVKSVYGGEVSGLYVVPGFSTVVIVSHGDYYTVYGNIAGASVKVGDKVKQGQTLGTLTEDAENPGKSSLHFEVWKGREKLNPQLWIQ